MADPLDEIRRLTKGSGIAPGSRSSPRAPAGRVAQRVVAPSAPAALEQAQSRRAERVALLIMLGIIAALWCTPLVYPLRLLVVFFHELSHAAVAILTGGSVVRIELSALEGGLAVTAGGNRFLTLTAGYLGSLAWGGAILLAAVRLRGGRVVTALLALLLLGVCLVWMRPLLSFGVLFTLLAGAALLWVALRLSHDANDMLLRIVGLTSLLYAPLDILDDAILRHGYPSDAQMLAQLTFIPALAWGLLWGGLSVALAWWFLRQAAR